MAMQTPQGGKYRSTGVSALIRAAPFQITLQTAEQFGLNPETLCAAAGIDRDELALADNRISLAAYGRLLKLCIELTQCAEFGLLASQRAGIDMLGFLGALARHSDSVRVALETMARLSYLHSDGTATTLVTDGRQARCIYAIYEPNVPAHNQIVESSLVIICNVLKALCGDGWQPDSILLPFRRTASMECYRQCLHITPKFNASEAAVVFRAHWLDQVPVQADRSRFNQLLSQIARAGKDSSDISLRVRRLLRKAISIGHGLLSEAESARMLGLHARELRRRMLAQGTSFRAVTDDVRRSVAQSLVTETTLPIAQISQILNYTDPSTLSRSFRRWANQSPAAIRAKQKQQAL